MWWEYLEISCETLGKAEKQDKNPESRLHNISSLFLFEGVRKMVVVENLLYILDTEVSSVVTPVVAMLVSITEVDTLMLLCVTGHAESLGPTFSRHDSLLV